MSENEENVKKPRRKRWQFTPEFKAGAVKLVLAEGKSSTEVAQDLGLTESALRIWVQQAKADRGEGKPGVGLAPRLHTDARLSATSQGLEVLEGHVELPHVQLAHPVEGTERASQGGLQARRKRALLCALVERVQVGRAGTALEGGLASTLQPREPQPQPQRGNGHAPRRGG